MRFLLAAVLGTVYCQTHEFNSTEEDSAPLEDLASVKDQVLQLVNQERAKAGRKKLCLNKQLGTAAQGHSDDQQKCRRMSHSGCNGSSNSQRMSKVGYKWKAIGENVAYNQKTAAAVMKSWMGSSGHRANILSKDFGNIGIGVSSKYYWTQDFGSPPSGSGCNVAAPTPKPPPAPTPPPAPVPLPGAASLVWVRVASTKAPGTDLPPNSYVVGTQPKGPTYACMADIPDAETHMVGSLSYANPDGKCRVARSGKSYYIASFYVLTLATATTQPPTWFSEPNGVQARSQLPANAVSGAGDNTNSVICRVKSYGGETNQSGSVSFQNTPAVCRIAVSGKAYYANSSFDILTYPQNQSASVY